jgi:hypothetical protein
MKPISWLAFASVLAASGCASGGSHVSSTPAVPTQTESTGARMIPYALPMRTDAAVEAALAAGRTTQNSIGNVPTILSVPITIGLVDAPLYNLSQVNIGIERINAIANSGSNETEVPLSIFPGDAVVNLLDYQSFSAIVAAAMIPAGSYNALEVVCDPAAGSVVTTDGRTLPLVYGNFADGRFSPSTTGHYSMVIPFNFNATIGINNELIDFNVENSINVQSNAAYVSASMFATSAASAGAVGGTLITPSGAPVQNATAVVTDESGNVVGLAPTDQNGNFIVHAISAGRYTLTIDEKYLTNAGVTLTASDGKTGALAPQRVTIQAGFETFVGTLKD